ncbi:hypothetical protein D3C81_1336410 [compost metagenome]
MPSRTSVTSENITVPPARTSRSVAKPTAGLAVTPEKASLPPHCTPTTRSDAGQVSRRRAFRRCRCFSAVVMIESIIDAKPTCCSSCRQTTSGSPSLWIGMVPALTSRVGCSFSQPRLTIITSPPKLGFSAILRMVRMGMPASGASIATPQP